jgi:hypothetical protein
LLREVRTLEMINIRGRNLGPPGKVVILKKKPTKELHECLDCEGCICEEFCREQDEKNFLEQYAQKEGD